MCGLVGVAGKINPSEKKIFRDLLILDQLRGRHSTGVLALNQAINVYTNEEVLKWNLMKEIGAPENLFNTYSEEFTDGVWDGNASLLMGHNRYATQGAVDKNNAHPFEFENVIGCHNGTVYDYSLRTFEGYDKFDVDSQVIFSQINHNPDVQEVWKEMDGAAALVWWDHRDEKLKFIRNSERPLSYLLINNGKTLVWASEDWMLMSILMHHKVTFSVDDIKSFPLNKVHSFDILNKNVKITGQTYSSIAKKNVPSISTTYDDITVEVGEELEESAYAGWGNYFKKSNVRPLGSKNKNMFQRKSSFLYMDFMEAHTSPSWGEEAKKYLFLTLDGAKEKGKDVVITVDLFTEEDWRQWESLGGDTKSIYFVDTKDTKFSGEDENFVYKEVSINHMQRSHIVLDADEYRQAKTLEADCAWCGFKRGIEEMSDNAAVGNEFVCKDCEDDYIRFGMGY